MSKIEIKVQYGLIEKSVKLSKTILSIKDYNVCYELNIRHVGFLSVFRLFFVPLTTVKVSNLNLLSLSG